MPSSDINKIRASRRKCYAKHRVAYRKKIVERKRVLRNWIIEYKRHLSCRKCGESHPACLEFHHRKASSKRFEIAAATRLGFSIETIKKEMKKCDVLCSNCHRKLHARSMV